jgi:hypothetical protein
MTLAGMISIADINNLSLDQLGVELAASTKPWSLAVYKYIRDFGFGDEMMLKLNNASFRLI